MTSSKAHAQQLPDSSHNQKDPSQKWNGGQRLSQSQASSKTKSTSPDIPTIQEVKSKYCDLIGTIMYFRRAIPNLQGQQSRLRQHLQSMKAESQILKTIHTQIAEMQFTGVVQVIDYSRHQQTVKQSMTDSKPEIPNFSNMLRYNSQIQDDVHQEFLRRFQETYKQVDSMMTKIGNVEHRCRNIGRLVNRSKNDDQS